MNNIIKFEKQERWENKWGISLGLAGILFGGIFGIAMPVYLTPLNFNGIILSGIILMLLGILYMMVIARTERINIDKLGENSQTYLLAVKEKLKNSGKRKGLHGIAYIAFVILGIICIYWGIFLQIVDGELFFNYTFWMPVLFGMLGWMFWRIRYSHKEKTKIEPLIEEIDLMLASID